MHHLRSVLLWHRSDDLCFALLLGGASEVAPGTGVECKVKGVLQVGGRVGVCSCTASATAACVRQWVTW